MRSKTTELYLNVLNNDYDIICLNETNLNSSIFNAELFDDRYTVFRRDRSDCPGSTKVEGGGIIMAVKEHLRVVRRRDWESCYEDIWLTILPQSGGRPPLNICLSYLPPDMSLSNVTQFFEHCQNKILNGNLNDSFMLLGDFNIPTVSWKREHSCEYLEPYEVNHARGPVLLETMALCGLFQYNDLFNSNGRLLDLVLYNNSNIIVNSADSLLKLEGHHPTMSIEISESQRLASVKHNNNSQRLNYWKCDYSMIKNCLSEIDWHNLLSELDIDAALNLFYSRLNEIIHQYTPTQRNSSSNYPDWYSKALINCLKEKYKYHKKFKKYGNPRDYDAFDLLRHRCKKMIIECHDRFVESTENNLRDNVKVFWHYVNSKKVNNSIPQNMTHMSDSATDSKGVCELFSNYFNSVYELPSDCSTDTEMVTNQVNLSNICITRQDIIDKIKKLDPNKGAGPDAIPARFVKTCGQELSIPLEILFNKSLKSGRFPDYWKSSFIIPILKSGDRTKCSNYRPISILSCMAKLFESLVYPFLFNHFKQSISQFQHGFVSGRSTVSNLLVYKSYICDAFDKRLQVDSIYTDFSKAFDKVSHSILIQKLSRYGIHGSLLRWIASYICNRSQMVAIKGFLSDPISVTSGVPQGSILGPLLFIVFINDLTNNISGNCLLYADDLKIFHSVSDVSDCARLQNDIDAVHEWCKSNRMSLNVNKCFVISFCTKKPKFLHDYNIDGRALERRNEAKDLGITFDYKLSFRSHYKQIVTRCNQLNGFLLRISKQFKNHTTLKYLYTTIVRPIIEYGSVIWSPYYKVHQDSIERVQGRCFRAICRRYRLIRKLDNYDARLKHFGTTSLMARRQRSQLLCLYKLIHSMIDCPELLSKINFNVVYRTRNRSIFSVLPARNNVSHNNPLYVMCRLYNNAKLDGLDIFGQNYKEFRIFVNQLFP